MNELVRITMCESIDSDGYILVPIDIYILDIYLVYIYIILWYNMCCVVMSAFRPDVLLLHH